MQKYKNKIARSSGFLGVSVSVKSRLAIQKGLLIDFDPSVLPPVGTTIPSIYSNINGAMLNGCAYSTASGGLLTFDGTDDYIETGAVLPTTVSLGVWMKTTRQSASNRPLGNADSTGGLNGLSLMIGYSAANHIYAVRRNGSNNGTRDMEATVSNLTTGWHYIVVTNSPTLGSVLYYDGYSVASNATTGMTSYNPLRIGRDGNGTDAFLGSIGHTHVYNVALTAAEVLANWNSTKARFS